MNRDNLPFVRRGPQESVHVSFWPNRLRVNNGGIWEVQPPGRILPLAKPSAREALASSPSIIPRWGRGGGPSSVSLSPLFGPFTFSPFPDLPIPPLIFLFAFYPFTAPIYFSPLFFSSFAFDLFAYVPHGPSFPFLPLTSLPMCLMGPLFLSFLRHDGPPHGPSFPFIFKT
jgi:hypothetical protein